jgi:hypothetical protein
MIDYLISILALGGLTLLGAFLLRALDRERKLKLLEILSLGYGIGLGLLAGEMLLLHLAGIEWTCLNTIWPLCLLAVLFLLAGGRLRFPSLPEKPKGMEWFFLCGIGFQWFCALMLASLTPLEAFDAAGIWGWKGKILFLVHGIPVEILGNRSYPIYHADYPLLVPLAESWIYTLLGHFNDFAAKLVFPFFHAALLGLFYCAAKRLNLNRRTCLVFTFLLASLPIFTGQASNGYVDIAIAFFLVASIFSLLFWTSTRRNSLLLLAAIFAGLSAMTKNEGLMLSLVTGITLVFCLWRERSRFSFSRAIAMLLVFSTVLLAVVSPWLIVRHQIGFANDLVNEKTWHQQVKAENLFRLGPILWQYQKIIFDFKNWNLIWVLFLAGMFYRLRRGLTEPEIYVLLPLGLALAGYTGIFLITTYDLQWHLGTATSRLFLHLAPLALFSVALAYREIVDEMRTSY